jgi:hypothetical protein
MTNSIISIQGLSPDPAAGRFPGEQLAPLPQQNHTNLTWCGEPHYQHRAALDRDVEEHRPAHDLRQRLQVVQRVSTVFF